MKPIRLAMLLSMGLLFANTSLGAPQSAAVQFKLESPGPVVNPNIYGHFSEHLGRCIYEGYWVGEDSPIPNVRGIRKDVVAALRQLDIPVLRWPGGCFADEYHWKNGIGPREKRPSMINTHWGGVVENNHFGTHEFFDLCEQLGTEPYICGNVGSGTVEEMMEWVEYMTSDADAPMPNLRRKNGRDKPWKLKYFGVGNESWGCGGNMRPEYYADLYRRYNTFAKNYAGNTLYRVAGGANVNDYNWTEVLMANAGKHMNGLSLHYYTMPGGWNKKQLATQFDEGGWIEAIGGAHYMEELISNHSLIMDKHDPAKKVGLVVDEWGIWSAPEPGTNPGFLYQQNTLRDAMVAALHFHIFQRHADRVTMANIAQTVNVLQAMILTDKEKMLLTPTYWVFEMFKGHQGGTLIPVEVAGPDYSAAGKTVPAISASATRDQEGNCLVSLVNSNPNEAISLKLALKGIGGKKLSGRILTASTMQAHNTFTAPAEVKPADFTAYQLDAEGLALEIPAKSIITLEIR